MLLTIDIGNTNITLGVFQERELKATWRLATDPRRMPDEYGLTILNLLAVQGISAREVQAVATCSVVPSLTQIFTELCARYFNVNPLIVGAGVRTGVKILYDNPRDVGADRIVDAAAAFRLYGGPCIIVDCGTATVLDAVSDKAEYLGGAIAPGLRLSAETLFSNTSLLRRVELEAPRTAIGKNTSHALQAGLVLGNVDLIEGMVRRFKRELNSGNCKVIGTGGQAPLIAAESGVFDHVNLELTLVGLPDNLRDEQRPAGRTPMKSPFQDRYVVLGVTGSIACYKAVDLCSKLVQAGAKVDVILTRSAQEFLTPLTFRSISHRAVVTELFDAESELSLEHVALAERAEVVVVAPATANTIAKMALGLADDALSATVLATNAPLVIAPAMDGNMFHNPAVQENLSKLKDRGAAIVGPAEGRLASGLVGKGRLAEAPEILGRIAAVLGSKGDLAGRRVIVTAGGTREAIDPVRVLTNRSSGKMGYAIAEAARDRGAHPLLITAPTGLPDPAAVEVQKVESAQDMCDAVISACESSDVVIMAAAVADYRAASPAEQKIKKGAAESASIQLARNLDILAEVNGVQGESGFCRRDRGPAQQRQEQAAVQGSRSVRSERRLGRAGHLWFRHQQSHDSGCGRWGGRPAKDDQVPGCAPYSG